MPQTGITLAIIVKNEAQWLGQMLDHHAELYDEAVVVDTGSTDESRSVAKAAGAKILDFQWCDDFSAARNFGLAEATGQWILVVDCDERIAVQDFSRVIHLAAVEPTCCYSLPQWNYTQTAGSADWEPTPPTYAACCEGAAGFVSAWSIRLFPNHPQVRYAGCVHETISRAGTALDFEHRQSDIPIHHYGHLQGWSQQKQRKESYFKLLLEKVQKKPQDSSALTELAYHLYERGEIELARRSLDSLVRRFPGGAEVHRARLLLGRILQKEGDGPGARAQFDLALRERPDWRSCWVESARAAFSQGDRERTTALVREGRRLFPLDPHLEGLETKVIATFGR